MRAVLSLGSNLGDRLGHIAGGLAVLAPADGLTLVAVSPVYETAPVGLVDQPAFLNAVVLAEVTSPRAALDAAWAAERSRDRVREQRWGPRTLDVDVITVDEVSSDEPVLTLPHPRAYERAFVLVPWLDVEPDASLSGHGRVATLVAGLDRTGVRRSADAPTLP